jgi:ATP-dependent 26S proteasome regulatory subunit
MFAIREDREEVRQADFEQAIEKITQDDGDAVSKTFA